MSRAGSGTLARAWFAAVMVFAALAGAGSAWGQEGWSGEGDRDLEVAPTEHHGVAATEHHGVAATEHHGVAATEDQGAASTGEHRATAIFAGGCFWCMEPPFDHLDGVVSTTSGYTGGHKVDPTYEEVSAGGTGHAESVKVVYDPRVVSYPQLLDVYWHNIDPLAEDRQFCDTGHQYRTAIFYLDDSQKAQAEESKRRLEQSGRFDAPIATEIVRAGTFYPAEDYHQDYYRKNPLRYKFYRFSCGRDQRLEEVWGKSAGD